MHQTIATIHSKNVDDIVSLIGAGQTAQLVEIRLDALWPGPPEADAATDDLLRITEAAAQANIKLLATLRPERQGGAFVGPEDIRVGLLVAAARSGFYYVDLDADNQDPAQIIEAIRDDAPRIIASDHRFPKAPGKDKGLIQLQAMQDSGAQIQKLAYPAGAFPDLLRAIELNHQFAQVNGNPSVQPMGYGGPMARALLPLAGCRATYGHAAGAKPAFSGQPSVEDIQAIWQHWGITGDDLENPGSVWIAVIGDPVDHSISPRIHNACLRAGGRPERYGALVVPNSMGAVRLLFGVANRLGLRGVGVTAPLKVHALDACQADEIATAVGAVNTVRFRGEAIEGTNTDVLGLQRALTDAPAGPVLVLGAGGVARAAIHAAKLCGREVKFTSRDSDRAALVAKQFDVPWVPWEKREVGGASVIIQCTTIGSDAADASPLPDLGGAQAVIELVYAGGQTAIETAARQAGLFVRSGIDCLIEQAADQYRFWTDAEPDMRVMREAIG